MPASMTTANRLRMRAMANTVTAMKNSSRMVEVTSSESDEPADYGIGRDRPAPYDFTIFTPRADISDRCAAMRAAMERAGAR